MSHKHLFMCITFTFAAGCQTASPTSRQPDDLSMPTEGTQDEYFPEPKNSRSRLHFYGKSSKKPEKGNDNNDEIEKNEENLDE